MPPGARRARAPSKNSRVKSAATPAIHGFDGSEMITSYCRRVSSRCERPSPTIRLVRGSDNASWFSVVKKREASTTSGEISSTSARAIGWRSAAPTLTPLPRPMMATSRGLLVHQQRQVRHQLLREHVAAVRGVHLAVHRERRGAGQPLHRDRGRRALAVVEHRPGLELRGEVEVLRHERRVHVRPARQQLAIPGGADDQQHRGGERGRQARRTSAAGQRACAGRRSPPRRSGSRSPPAA